MGILFNLSIYERGKICMNSTTKKVLIIVPLSLIILGTISYSIYSIYMENEKKNIKVDIRISTIGDSITDGGNYQKTMGFGEKWNFGYQINIYESLKTRNIESSILNLGISGNLISQICSRFNDTVPADYIISMGGTNNVWWWANYTNPAVQENLSQTIITTYNNTIFNTIQYQISLGNSGPILIICSIPPIGKSLGNAVNITNAIKYVNTNLQAWVIGLNRSDILFCDVYRNMRNAEGYMIEGLSSDGVHFTSKGNEVCGQTMAQVISDHYYSQ
jgi:lysophospholipase L1-like esterase